MAKRATVAWVRGTVCRQLILYLYSTSSCKEFELSTSLAVLFYLHFNAGVRLVVALLLCNRNTLAKLQAVSVSCFFSAACLVFSKHKLKRWVGRLHGAWVHEEGRHVHRRKRMLWLERNKLAERERNFFLQVKKVGNGVPATHDLLSFACREEGGKRERCAHDLLVPQLEYPGTLAEVLLCEPAAMSWGCNAPSVSSVARSWWGLEPYPWAICDERPCTHGSGTGAVISRFRSKCFQHLTATHYQWPFYAQNMSRSSF